MWTLQEEEGQTTAASNSDASLSDALNNLYARFDIQRDATAGKITLSPKDQVISLITVNV